MQYNSEMKRTKACAIRMTLEEHGQIVSLAREAGVSFTEWVIRRAMGGEISREKVKDGRDGQVDHGTQGKSCRSTATDGVAVAVSGGPVSLEQKSSQAGQMVTDVPMPE
jgi:hypothetical protein